MDNIVKMARRQGLQAVAFVVAARVCYAMLQSYSEACPEASEHHPGRRRGTCSVVQYIERVTAASGLVRDAVGEMMRQ